MGWAALSALSAHQMLSCSEYLVCPFVSKETYSSETWQYQEQGAVP